MIQTEGIFSGGAGGISAPVIGEDFNWTGGDGTYQVLDDGGGNWRIKFLSSGTFTPLKNMVVDAFLVGGGGRSSSSSSAFISGGGAGYTTTVKSVVLEANTAYPIVVGAAGSYTHNGGKTSAFSAAAEGGHGTSDGTFENTKPGGAGGSGGGGSASYGTYCAGGTDGGDGVSGNSAGGKGQGTTTREFGEADGDLYASGGGSNLTATVPNSGNGGINYIPAADGIVIIRQHKEVAA